jgi:ATPase family associated with various cellular activities (AAA)
VTKQALRSVASPPRPDPLTGYLTMLRDSLDRLLLAYQQQGPEVLEAQAVACIGLHLDPVPHGAWSPADPAGTGILLDRLGMTAAAEAIVAAAWWAAADPQLAIAFGLVHDDIARRYPSLAALRLLLEPYGIDVPLALPADTGPVADGLLCPVTGADAPVRLTQTAALLLAGWRPPAEPDRPPPGRLDEPAEPDRPLPGRLVEPAERAAALLREGHLVVLRCAEEADGAVLARAVAGRLGRALDTDTERPVAETALLDRLGLVLPAGETEAAPTRLRLAAAGAPAAPGWQVLDVPAIGAGEVHRAWRHALAAAGLDAGQAAGLVARMRLPEATIDDLVRDARAAAAAAGRDVGVADLHTAVRRHPHHRLDGMARLLPPSLTLDDLVLSQNTRTGLTDLLAHARHSSAVTARWPGIRGRAVVALLHGPSGTGKTAASEAIAAELDRDLWIVDLAQVVSKWLGETSRNLDRLLTEAERGGAVLLFDEAEGLFGRRGEISDARDRYANLEIDHLLQRIELHEGLVVLTSNRPASLDEGFQRRLRLSIRFELPDHAGRRQIWAALLPAAQLADGANLDDFAAAELSGAGVRAAALSALVFAAEDGTLVRADHLNRAIQRELAKSGHDWTPRPSRGGRP